MCLALRVLRMQIGYPADLSASSLRCSARLRGLKPAFGIAASRFFDFHITLIRGQVNE